MYSDASRSWWPFLPFHEIAPMFVRLSVQTQAQPLLDLVDYMKRQWIENPVFTPQDWSVYKQPIRTNNDMEGWHNALNRRAGGQWLTYWTGRRNSQLSPLGWSLRGNWSACSIKLTDIYKPSCLNTGSSMTTGRRPPRSSSRSVHI